MPPTPTAHAAFDLDATRNNILQARQGCYIPVAVVHEIDLLVAAVEALRDEVGGLNIDLVNAGNDNEELRERVAEHDTLFDLAQKRERPWIEAWREATGKHNTLPDYGKMLAWICDRAESAEAQLAALSAARAEELERARAVEEIVTAAGDLMHRFNDTRAVAFGIADSEDANIFAEWYTLEITLARLDLSTEAPAKADAGGKEG